MDTLFLDAAPTVKIIGGLVHIAVKGHPLVMQLSTFQSLMGAGHRALVDFDRSGADQISFAEAKARLREH